MKTKSELLNGKLSDLKEYAKELSIENISKYKKAELIEEILKAQELKTPQQNNENDFSSHVEGILEVLEDGYGFVRSDNYLSGPNDVFVSPTFIRKFNLKTGDWILGKSRMQREGEKFAALIYR